jgi:hypothetical protein
MARAGVDASIQNESFPFRAGIAAKRVSQSLGGLSTMWCRQRGAPLTVGEYCVDNLPPPQ